jgi:hypothetical protein
MDTMDVDSDDEQPEPRVNACTSCKPFSWLIALLFSLPKQYYSLKHKDGTIVPFLEGKKGSLTTRGHLNALGQISLGPMPPSLSRISRRIFVSVELSSTFWKHLEIMAVPFTLANRTVLATRLPACALGA